MHWVWPEWRPLVRKASLLMILIVALASGCGGGETSDAATTCWPDDAVAARNPDDQPVQWKSAPRMVIDENAAYRAVLETSKGTITWELLPNAAPVSVNNFVCLARAGYYDDTPFHRILAGFVIQGGDPTGTGTGGPGYQFDDEPVQGEYTAGTVAMANAGSDTNGSQFFIILDDLQQRLPENYNLFGQVIGGEDVVAVIAQTPTGADSRGEVSVPLEEVILEKVTIEENPGPGDATPG